MLRGGLLGQKASVLRGHDDEGVLRAREHGTVPLSDIEGGFVEMLHAAQRDKPLRSPLHLPAAKRRLGLRLRALICTAYLRS